MLPRDVVAQRIKAARILRGVHQSDLGLLFKEDGLGKEDVGRLEREDIDLRRAHIDALVRHLHVPDWWFTDPELDLPAELPESGKGQVVRLEQAIAALTAKVDALLGRAPGATTSDVLEEAAQAAEELAENREREERRA